MIVCAPGLKISRPEHWPGRPGPRDSPRGTCAFVRLSVVLESANTAGDLHSSFAPLIVVDCSQCTLRAVDVNLAETGVTSGLPDLRKTRHIPNDAHTYGVLSD